MKFSRSLIFQRALNYVYSKVQTQNYSSTFPHLAKYFSKMPINRICCFVEGYEDYGIFIAAMLACENGNKDKIRKSEAFREKLKKDVSAFNEIYSYNPENIQKYFNR